MSLLCLVDFNSFISYIYFSLVRLIVPLTSVPPPLFCPPER